MFKKIQIAFVFLMLSVVSAGTAEAQTTKLQKANNAYSEFSFIKAAKLYKEVIDKGNSSAELYNKLADCYYYNGDYADAVANYAKGTSAKSVSNENYLRYAQALNTMKKFDEAERVMDMYYAKTGTENLSQDWSENRLKEGIERQSGRYTFSPATGINTPYSDFGGTVFEKDKLIYTSAKDAPQIPNYKHSWNEQSFLKLYTANITESGKLENPTLLKGDINTQYHQSSPTITKDGKFMFFTKNNYNYKDGKIATDKKGKTYLKLYSAENVKGKWTNIKELEYPVNSDGFSSAHPALSADETELFFVSDRDNKFGNSDLYVVSLNKGGFVGKDVRKLGDEINTLGRETFPYVDASGILYFSSDGHPGMGGLDVFAAVKDENGFYHVVNLGDGVNSNADDFAYTICDETKKGYFSSNRSGNDDIYSFTENRPVDFDVDIRPLVYGVIKDSKGEPLPGVTVEVYNAEGSLIETVLSDSKGGYEVNARPYQNDKIVFKKVGLIEDTIEVDSMKPFEKREFSPTLINERQVIIDGETKEIKGDLTELLTLKPIYFDYAGSSIRETSKPELDRVVELMRARPNLIIKVNSHTDSRGKDDYNMRLSQNRAKATVAYIVKAGIAADRISGEGFGETMLINHCSNGVKCTEQEHELNRRSEFIVSWKQ